MKNIKVQIRAALIILFVLLTSKLSFALNDDFFAGWFSNNPVAPVAGRGIRANISTPSSLTRYSQESVSNWVMTMNPSNHMYFIQSGWRIYNTTIPQMFYEFCGVYGCSGTIQISNHNWNTIVTYEASWYNSLISCAYANNIQYGCTTLNTSYPMDFQVYSEVHNDPRNSMSANFTSISYSGTNDGVWRSLPSIGAPQIEYPYGLAALSANSFTTFKNSPVGQQFGPLSVR